jgi:LuxR family maltose regulon positive regulatory protein
VVGLVDVETAALLCEWNDVDAAFFRLQRGLDYLLQWGKTDDFCLAYITQSRIQLAQGNGIDAAAAIEQAAQLIQTCGVFSEARNAVEAAQVKMWLAQGDPSLVDRWVTTLEKRLALHDSFRYEDELTRITQARVFIAQNKLDEANRLLSCLEESALSDGRQGRLIEIMILKALTLQKMGSNAQADLALTKSLTLAEPSGYVRIYLDEGQPMQMLLAKWMAHAKASPLRDYAIRLLSQFKVAPHVATATQVPPPPIYDPAARQRQSGQTLVEPLSQRELEVLDLMALGKTNREIAGQLIVAPGTVKAHTASIYRKLDAINRTQAVARARQLGILP